MRDDPVVIDLVRRAAAGEQRAWNEIVERYAPLVWSICQRCQLDRQDIDDIGQSVWLLLVERIGSLRDPAALPGWVVTTTHRECLRVLRASRRNVHDELPPPDQLPLGPEAAMAEQLVLTAERNAALRAAFAELPRGCRELLSMLMCDPPCTYAKISATLNIPVGSIGPTRSRCLERVRRSRHVTAIVDIEIQEQRGLTGKEWAR
jgi:RNA polymerase sigma factor (sigma-70 family)